MRISENDVAYQMYNNGYSKAESLESVKEEQKSAQPTVESNLRTYEELCRQFPGISFRLEDESDTLGFYAGGLHQKGNNFGNPGQKSISIDVKVIERMQQDADYAMQVKGSIEYARENYSELELREEQSGCIYSCFCLSDEGGALQTATMHYASPFSTEEEIKKMWEIGENISKAAQDKIQQAQNELTEGYFALIEKTNLRIREQMISQEKGR